MKTHLPEVTLAIVLVAGVAPWAPCGVAAAQDTNRGVETEYASCLLKITFGNDLALNRKTVGPLLNSSGILGAALDELSGLDPAARAAAHVGIGEYNEMVSHEGKQSVLVALFEANLWLPAERAQVKRTLHSLCRRLEAELQQVGVLEQQQLRAQLTEVQAAVRQAQQRYTELQTLRQELSVAAGRTELSRHVIVEQIQADERELSALDTRLAALRARRSALTEQIAHISGQVAAHVNDDPAVIELSKVVQLREAHLNRWQDLVANGRAGADDAQAAEEALALARAELAKQRQLIAQRAGGELLAELNKELVTLTVDIAAAEAQRECIRHRLTQVQEMKLLELADRYEREVRSQIAAAEQVLSEALKRQAELESRLASYRPPTVIVLGGTAPS